MFRLICYLTALKYLAKSTHYKVNGDAFFSKHLLCDKVAEVTGKHRDAIYEVCFLGHQILPPEPQTVLKKTTQILDELGQADTDDERFLNIYFLLLETLNYIESLDGERMSVGDKNVLGAVAQDLQQVLGFIWAEIKVYAYESLQEEVFMPVVKITIKGDE